MPRMRQPRVTKKLRPARKTGVIKRACGGGRTKVSRRPWWTDEELKGTKKKGPGEILSRRRQGGKSLNPAKEKLLKGPRMKTKGGGFNRIGRREPKGDRLLPE